MPPPRRKHPIRKPPSTTTPSQTARQKIAARDAAANTELLTQQILQSEAPKAVKDFFTRPDYRKDIRAWNTVYEAYLAHLWGPESTNKRIDLEKPEDYQTWLSEPAIFNRDNKRKNVREYTEKLAQIVLRAELKNKSLLARWKGLSDAQREEEFFVAMKKMTEAGREESQTRNEVPEITLARMTSNGGQGFVDLVNHFVNAYKNAVTNGTDMFVPLSHDVWERIYLFNRKDDDVPVPKGIRAFQEEMLLDRHLYMILFCVSVLLQLDGVEIKMSRAQPPPAPSVEDDNAESLEKLTLDDTTDSTALTTNTDSSATSASTTTHHPLTPGLVRQISDFSPENFYHIYYTSPSTGEERKQPLTFRSNIEAVKSFLPIRNAAIQARDNRACGLLCAILIEGTVDDYAGGEVTEEMVANQMKVDFGWTQEDLDQHVPPEHVLVQLDVVPDLPEVVQKAEEGGSTQAKTSDNEEGCGHDHDHDHDHDHEH